MQSPNQRELNQLAEEIEDALIEMTCHSETPIIIHRYDAKSGSIYLKLDWGAAWSIRIADHKGYDNLAYRFNIFLDDMPASITTDDRGLPRYWFSAKDATSAVMEILNQRQHLIDQYDVAGYLKRMDTCRRRAKSSRFYRHPQTHDVQYADNKKARVPLRL